MILFEILQTHYLARKQKIIVQIKFNDWAKPGFDEIRRSKTWIEERLLVFMKHTLKSLISQTNQDFLTFIRYDESTEDLIMQAIGQYPPLPQNVQFIDRRKYDAEVKKNIIGYDWLYLVRIDSDDMYHKSYIKRLHDYKPKEGTVVLINQEGYIYDSVNKQLATYYYFSPPFYTFLYAVNEYLEGKRYKIGGHPTVFQYPHEILKGRNFMYVVHSKNNVTKFNTRYRGHVIKDKQKAKQILDSFFG